MNKLFLKSLKLENFKGIKDLTVDFENSTSVMGANATGKTTIFDAYSWLLWGKDSTNRKDFNIKPFNENGEEKHGIESVVAGVFEFEDKEFELKKVYKEIWTKKRGQVDATFTGNTTDYFINDVPIKKSEYDDRISSIVNESEFNLLSNPMYFSSILDKKERRNVLLSLIKDVSKDDVLEINKDLENLELDNYTIDELKAMAKSSLKKVNDEIQSLPVRIDELEKSKKDFNFVELENDKDKYEKAIGDLDVSIAKTSEVTEVLANKNRQIQDKYEELRKIKAKTDEKNEEIQRGVLKEFNARKDKFEENKRELKSILLKKENTRDNFKDDLKILDKKIKTNEEEVENLRERWILKNDEVFSGDLSCPTCKKEFDEDKKDEILSNFNLEKSKLLSRIQEQAEDVKKLLEQQKEDYNYINEAIKKLDKEIKELEGSILNYGEFKEEIPVVKTEDYPAEYHQLQLSIDTLNEELRNITKTDNSALLEQKRDLQKMLDDVKEKLSWKKNNEEIEKKIDLYKSQEKELAKIYEEKQRVLYLCEEYTRVYTDLVQNKINNLFKDVNFRLFKTLVNGGIEEVCDVMVNGVPYSDVNNAGKINAGLDVINTLSKHFEKQVPIFVDNAESVNKLIDTDSQIVKLYVSNDKKLKIINE